MVFQYGIDAFPSVIRQSWLDMSVVSVELGINIAIMSAKFFHFIWSTELNSVQAGQICAKNSACAEMQNPSIPNYTHQSAVWTDGVGKHSAAESAAEMSE